jgi:hypothetical protein
LVAFRALNTLKALKALCTSRSGVPSVTLDALNALRSSVTLRAYRALDTLCALDALDALRTLRAEDGARHRDGLAQIRMDDERRALHFCRRDRLPVDAGRPLLRCLQQLKDFDLVDQDVTGHESPLATR